MNGLPRLYQHYIGHENNRDFLANTQMETKNDDRVLYHEWFPQILYNHHQSGPAGTVVYSPPFRDPYNYNLDPILLLGLQSLGAAMHTRLAVEGKGGATMRSGGPYDGWWNGGIRNTATFHNSIAMLTEMIGSPTPQRIPLVLDRQIPTGDLAMPVAPQEWHFRQSIDYSISLNRAVLDYASRLRENLLYDIYVMGKHSIERGSQDTWTANPRRDAAIAAKLNVSQAAGVAAEVVAAAATTAEQDKALWAAMHAPELRDPRGYILPSNQVDFPTATKFINMLLESGITVHRATRDFDVGGKHYPAGSYVVLTAQAFRPHIIDMFEPQVHPDVFPIPGGPPTRPYDNAGLDDVVPDRRRVRSHSRRIHRTVREDRTVGRRAAGRQDQRDGGRGRIRHRQSRRQLVRRGHATAQGERGRLSARVAAHRERKVVRRRRALRASQAVDRRRAAANARARRQLRGDHGATAGRRREAARAARRHVGRLRRQPGSRVDALGARRRTSSRSIACSRLRSTPAISIRSTTFSSFRRAAFPDRRWVAAVAAAVRDRSDPESSGRVSGSGRTRDGGADAAEDSRVHREGRDGDRDRHVGGESRRVPPSADREPARRERRAASADEVVHSGIGALGAGGSRRASRRTACSSTRTCSSTTVRSSSSAPTRRRRA